MESHLNSTNTIMGRLLLRLLYLDGVILRSGSSLQYYQAFGRRHSRPILSNQPIEIVEYSLLTPLLLWTTWRDKQSPFQIYKYGMLTLVTSSGSAQSSPKTIRQLRKEISKARASLDNIDGHLAALSPGLNKRLERIFSGGLTQAESND